MSQPPSGEKSPYHKRCLSIAEQIEKLREHGLTVDRPAVAESFLSHVGYYRFYGFCIAFESSHHRFQKSVAFEDIRTAYLFDAGLRDLMTEALEMIEIDLRTGIAQHFGERYGAFGHTKPDHFYVQRGCHPGGFHHSDWIGRLRTEAKDSREPFIDRYSHKYDDYPDLPIWMLVEIMSFGALARMYRGMLRDDQKTVSARYNVQPADLGTIILHFSYARNLCAHHARLWDRTWTVKPTMPRGKFFQPPEVPTNDRLYSTLLLLYRFLKSCRDVRTFATDWRTRLHELLDRPPNAPNSGAKMGMPINWKLNLEWR